MRINLVIPCNLRARFLQEQVREPISEIDDRLFWQTSDLKWRYVCQAKSRTQAPRNGCIGSTT
jgi:hypothetical protein